MEDADERDKEAKLETMRTHAMNAILAIWRQVSQVEIRLELAAKLLPSLMSRLSPSHMPHPPSHSTTLSSVDFGSFLHSLISAHPADLSSFQSELIELCYALLLASNTDILKITIDCIAAITAHLTTDLQESFTSRLLTSFTEFERRKRETQFFQSLAILIRVSGNAFQPVSTVIRLIHAMLFDDTGRYDGHSDARDSGLHCLDTLFRHAPLRTIEQIPTIIPIIQVAAHYDPNYVGEEDEHARMSVSAASASRAIDPAAAAEDDEEEDYGLGDADSNSSGEEDTGDLNDADEILNSYVDVDEAGDGDGDDDDDDSWKVRRGASRCIQSILNLIIIGTGACTEAQQQAYESVMPKLFVQTICVGHRSMLIAAGMRIGSEILLPRLTERTDYIQIDLIDQYQEFLQWATRMRHLSSVSATFPSLGTSGLTLFTQLTRLFTAPIRPKPTPSDLRRLEHQTSLLNTVIRLVPTNVWCAAHSGLFRHVLARLSECLTASIQIAPLAAAPTRLTNTINLLHTIELCCQHVDARVWSGEVTEAHSLLLGWFESHLTALDASAAPAPALLTLATTAIRVIGQISALIIRGQTDNCHVKVSIIECCLDGSTRHGRPQLPPEDEIQKEQETEQEWLDQPTRDTTIVHLHRVCLSILTRFASDRLLVGETLVVLGRLYRLIPHGHTQMDTQINMQIHTQTIETNQQNDANTQTKTNIADLIQSATPIILESTRRLMDGQHANTRLQATQVRRGITNHKQLIHHPLSTCYCPLATDLFVPFCLSFVVQCVVAVFRSLPLSPSLLSPIAANLHHLASFLRQVARRRKRKRKKIESTHRSPRNVY